MDKASCEGLPHMSRYRMKAVTQHQTIAGNFVGRASLEGLLA
jgi:putative component of membrane protein insertase Oxa1/YidC/SpoIIIJ protein YidD